MAVNMRPGTPCSSRFELQLQAAQAFVVQAHVAQHLRGDIVVRIEALKLLLKVDALEGPGGDQRLHFGGGLRRDAPRDPGKVAPGRQTRGDLLLGGPRVFRIGVDDCGESMSGCLFVFDLGGHGEDGVNLHGHGQLAQIAVIKHAAARCHLEGALLLLFRALDVLLVLHHLEPEEARGNQDGPEQKKQADKPEARQLQRRGAQRGVAVPAGSNGRRHGKLLRL